MLFERFLLLYVKVVFMVTKWGVSHSMSKVGDVKVVKVLVYYVSKCIFCWMSL